MHMERKKRSWQGWISRSLVAMFVASAVSLAGHATCLAATSVTLAWNASSGATGYKVYYQADSATQPFKGTGATQGSAPINVGNVTSATLSGLDPARTYYAAVTAFNTSGESTYSNVVTIKESVAPTVSITAPANNATATGTVSVTANATDNVGVTKLEFYVNGSLAATDTSTPYLYSWNTGSLAAGTYTLMAKAYDAAGNVAQSGNVSASVVKDSTAPSVMLTSPSNGATLTGNATCAASASDNIGITKVEFYANNTLLSATNVAPYSYTWNTATVSNGNYTIHAKAYDAAGNVTSCATTTTVQVANNVTTPPPFSITTASLTAGRQGVAYSTTLAASGGTTPYLWSISSGSLPAGLSLNGSTGVISGTPTTSGSFNFTVQVTDSSSTKKSASKALTLSLAAATTTTTKSLWPSTKVPSVVDGGADNSVELGVKFRSDTAGYITGIRFYKASNNTGTHTGTLWSSTGTKLATATFTNETASGWQQVNFATPVAISANTVYVASYHCNGGHYSADSGYFSGKGMDTAPLHALADGVSGVNGVYTYGTGTVFPKSGYYSSNYWVDVVYRP